jgi:hypothetical protein
MEAMMAMPPSTSGNTVAASGAAVTTSEPSSMVAIRVTA